MCSIALNVAISYYRKGRRAAPTIHFAGDLHLMNIEDRSEGPEEKEGQLQLLQQFIAELGELDKALMILYLEEHSYREIGEVLGISETNVATKISRIKGRLKQKFSTINQML
jgi:RNA polymerase sigma-70 factor (ECF subfamily)